MILMDKEKSLLLIIFAAAGHDSRAGSTEEVFSTGARFDAKVARPMA
jgi:hypothetical protein